MSDSSWGRVPGVLMSPARTFAAIVERPSFLPPILCLLLTGIAFGMVATAKLDYGDTIRESFERRGMDMPEEDLQRGMEIAEKFGWVFALLAILVLQPASYLLTALLFWLVFKVLGSEMPYRTSLSVTLHSLLPLALVALVSLPIALGREALSGEEMQAGLLLSNLAFLAGEDTPAWVVAALRCFDFFGLWSLALFVLGYRAATRLSAATATATVVVAWLAWCAVKVGWAAVSSLFG